MYDDQLNANFLAAGDLKMSDLAFYNPAVSDNMLDVDAEFRAARLDNHYRMQGGATLKNGQTIPKAVAAMKTVFKNKDKLVRDLAAQADAIYNF
jgi:hypothetical protein